tara:strand:- start:730 stop:921 length:192 start_codon:yes stop_codon:yes gene_type:complete
MGKKRKRLFFEKLAAAEAVEAVKTETIIEPIKNTVTETVKVKKPIAAKTKITKKVIKTKTKKK